MTQKAHGRRGTACSEAPLLKCLSACQELKTGGAVGLGQADSPPHNSCTRVPDDKFVPSPLTAVSCVFVSLRAGFTKLWVGSFVKMKEMQRPRYLNRAATVGFSDVSWESEA